MKRLLLLVILAALALAQKPIPRYSGDDNPQHDGQPMWCQNMDRGGYSHNCACKGMTKREDCGLPGDGPRGGGESASCSVYCRKSACRCVSPCES